MTKTFLADTHCHLYFDAFNNDLDKVIQAAEEAGFNRLMVPGIDLISSRQAVELAETYDCVYAAAGVHPNTDEHLTKEKMLELSRLLQHEKVLAVGEIGLDYYRDSVPPADQKKKFRLQLDLAVMHEMPVIMHCREAANDFLLILEEWNSRNIFKYPPGVWHSFSGTREQMERAVDLGLYIGISGPITYKNAEALREVAKDIPLDRILLETDAPFLTPQQKRGKRNQPAYAVWVNEKLAEIKNIKPDEFGKIASQNSKKLFKW